VKKNQIKFFKNIRENQKNGKAIRRVFRVFVIAAAWLGDLSAL